MNTVDIVGYHGPGGYRGWRWRSPVEERSWGRFGGGRRGVGG